MDKPDLDPAVLESFLDQLPIGVIVVDDEGIIQRFNRYEEQLSGLSREETIGKSFFSDVAPCTDDIELREKFKRGIEQGNLDLELEFSFPYPYNRVARDVHIRAFSAEAGDTHANFMLIKEITSRRELEKTNEEMLSGLRAMLDGEESSSEGLDGDDGLMDPRTDGPIKREAVCLYADLSSFQSVAEQVGPEDLFGYLDGRIRQAVQSIHRYGGNLDKISGDSVRGYFLIEEEQQHRPFYDALRAARDIVESESDHELELPFRIGLSNGPLLSGLLGREEFAQKARVGHPVTVARKIAGLASSADVVMTGEIADRCSGVLDTTELPRMSISGLDDYWPLHRLEDLDLPAP